ncbi:leucine-rich repeat domain-containing protein [Paraflavitalea soli]|uniref:Leucine-rich repeat domain-containing protein n=2 Tax=Paraflavitalea soli TaxID=2315862 RepID=A0A3B7MNM9_9BACT|nr:leucine-rich repeat domain-containing protein [Paraflavitalea soli]
MQREFEIFKTKDYLIILTILLLAPPFACRSQSKSAVPYETPIDKVWWEGLSNEWKAILLVNQQFQKQQVDFFALQENYINRMQAEGEADYSPINLSLHELNEKQRFSLGYPDFYARALRMKWMIPGDTIDLEALKDLDKIYMVNGPGDLTPLKKFTNLKILIINSCGIDVNSPVRTHNLDLGPLRYLSSLEMLQCSSPALISLEPIKRLTNLKQLDCGISGVTDLAPLKDLVKLERLSCRGNLKNEAVISKLTALKELYLNGCSKMPDISRLKKIEKLAVGESEMAIGRAGYRITNIDILRQLPALEFLDLELTSYKGSLDILNGLQKLKAITLPPVSTSTMLEFKKQHESCVIINAYKYER